MKKSKRFKIVGSLLVIAALCLSIGRLYHTPTKEFTIQELDTLVTNQKVVRAKVVPTIYDGVYTIEGTFKSAADKLQSFSLTTHLDQARLQRLTEMKDVKIHLPGQGSRAQWVNIIATLFIAGLVGFVVLHLVNIGKSQGSHKVRSRPKVRFDDIAGIEEAKAEVQEVVDFLRNPRKYKRLGGTLPKGILLIGPPGTGKTMLAKAIAGEADANFFSAHGSDFNEVFVGVGAKRIRQIFREAAKHKPAIIFIDEIDCLGKNRKFDTHGELQQTNNALLAAMDGFESNEGIVVVAATNRPEDLDEALMRPGRFDRKVFVPYPDMRGRRAILETHTRNKPIADKARALEILAKTTPGMSGADLASIINEAAILCAQQNGNKISMTELEASRDKVRFGKERKSMVVSGNDRETVAYHEAGHAIVNLQKSLLPKLYKVSIVPRGNALGTTTLLPDEDQNISSKELLLEQLALLMGGRAAEKVFLGSTTNGAAGDLETARNIARKMIYEWGMGQKLYYEPEQRDAEMEVNRILENADREALAIVEFHRKNTKRLAEALLTFETLTREEVLDLLKTEAPAGSSSGMAFSV
jgi:cell division protease FtsH